MSSTAAPMARHKRLLSSGEASSSKRANALPSRPQKGMSWPGWIPQNTIYIAFYRSASKGKPRILEAFTMLKDAECAIEAYARQVPHPNGWTKGKDERGSLSFKAYEGESDGTLQSLR